MTRRPAEGVSTARVAVIGADTPVGAAVRAALESSGVPGARVDLFGATRGEAVLSEYAGEARLIQDPDPAEVGAHGLVFVCESGPATDRAIAGCGGETLVLDLVGSSAGPDARLIHADVPHSLPATGGRVAVAHPLTIALVELLAPVDAEIGLREATAVVMRPAADFGDEGPEELRKQVVSLFSFGEVPKKVFGWQLAFNVLPQACFDEREPGLAPRVVGEVERLLGWPAGRLAIQILTVPVFHGHALTIRLEPGDTASADRIAACLARGGRVDVDVAGGVATPIEVTGERRTLVSGIQEDGGGGFWMWAVVGEAAAAAAEQAVRLARATGRL